MKLKKIFQAGIVLAGVGLGNTASAATPLGCYPWEKGKISVSINVPSQLKVYISTPRVELIETANSFSADHSFFLRAPLLDLLTGLGVGVSSQFNGTWKEGRSSRFSADITSLDELDAMLTMYLEKKNADDVKVTRKFNGSVNSDSTKMTGSMDVGVSVLLRAPEPDPDLEPDVDTGKVLGKATVKFSAQFSGMRASEDPLAVPCGDPLPATGLSALLPKQAKPIQVPSQFMGFGQTFVDAVKIAESKAAQ